MSLTEYEVVQKMKERGFHKIPSLLITPETEYLYKNIDKLWSLIQKGRGGYLDHRSARMSEPEPGSWGSEPNMTYGLNETGFIPTKEELDGICELGANIVGTFLVKNIFRANVICDFDKEEETTISIKAGDIVIITERTDDEWWFGYIDDDEENDGYFPASYVKLCE
jgi:hypothetical protein